MQIRGLLSYKDFSFSIKNKQTKKSTAAVSPPAAVKFS